MSVCMLLATSEDDVLIEDMGIVLKWATVRIPFK